MAPDRNGYFAGLLALADEYATLGQMEQAQEVDEIALDEAQAAQIIQLLAGEAQLAQLVHLGAYFVEIGPQIDARSTALVAVLDLCSRKMMQHDLHHAEFVQVRVEQRCDDHDGAKLLPRNVSAHHSIPRAGGPAATTGARVLVAPPARIG